MRVYHFLNEEYGLKDLREKRLKISRLMQLNDPFEFLSVILSDKDVRNRLHSAKERLDKVLGLICFSKSWKSPAQWAHYANRHKGLCLGFDIPNEKALEVEYVDNRIIHNNKPGEFIVRNLLTYKYSHWSYEQEVRIFEKLENYENEIYYKNFGDDLKLKEVIVGINSTITRSTITSILEGYESKITAFKARPAFKKFEIVRNLNSRNWV